MTLTRIRDAYRQLRCPDLDPDCRHCEDDRRMKLRWWERLVWRWSR